MDLNKNKMLHVARLVKDTLIAFFKIYNTLIVNKKVDGLRGIMKENDILIVEHINKICYFFPYKLILICCSCIGVHNITSKS
jgi:hypothetical protein